MFSFLKKLFGKQESAVTTPIAEPLRGEWTSVEVKPAKAETTATQSKPKRPAKPKAKPKATTGTQQQPKKAKPANKPKVNKQ